MAQYTVQAPDGHIVTLEGPPGASHDEVIAQAQKLYQPGQQTARQRAEQKVADETDARRQANGAIEGAPDFGKVGNTVLAAGMHFVHQLPLVGDLALTAGQAGVDGRTWKQANDLVHRQLGSAQASHPVASTAGGVAGGIDSAIVGGAALKSASGGQAVLKALPAATTTAQRAANVGRVAVASGLAGGAQQAAQNAGEKIAAGDILDAPQAAVEGARNGAVAGAVAGPVGGAAAAVVKKVGAPLATKTALALAKVFGENPADLQAAWSTFKASTGRAPTMAELATLKQRGQIAGAAKDSTIISTALSEAADAQAAARSAQMQEALGGNSPPRPLTPAPAELAAPTQAGGSAGEIANAKTAQGDIDYPAARAHDFTIPTEEDAALGGISAADHLASQVLPLAGLKTADRVRIAEGLKNGVLSGEDAQMLRSKLGKAQGTGANYSPAIASATEDLDAFLASPGNEAAHEALSKANATYQATAQRQAGAEHGETVLGEQTADNFAAEAAAKPNANGNFAAGAQSGARSKLADKAATPAGATSLAQRLGTDDALHAKLTTLFGKDTADAFQRLGAAETGAAENLAPFKGKTPKMEGQDEKDLNTGLRALAATASHGVYQFYHGAKALTGLGMPLKVQETVARYLSDPKMTQQGINLLRKAGATNAQIRQLTLDAAVASGIVGESAVESVTEQ